MALGVIARKSVWVRVPPPGPQRPAPVFQLLQEAQIEAPVFAETPYGAFCDVFGDCRRESALRSESDPFDIWKVEFETTFPSREPGKWCKISHTDL